MPSKPAKYGIKSWVACDARTSYAWKMQVYTGKAAAAAPPEKNMALRVVLDVTEGLAAPRNVTCDNFFTSYELARRLLRERGLTVVGTIRKNKPELPPALLACKNRRVFSSRFAYAPLPPPPPPPPPRSQSGGPLGAAAAAAGGVGRG